MMMTKFRTLTSVSALGLFLAGCSIIPEEIVFEEHKQRVSEDLQHLYEKQEVITKPITMYEAMARAIKYNMDNRLKMMEVAVSKQQLNSATMGLLPKLTANAGYSERSKPDASNSATLGSSSRSTSYSYSEDDDIYTADLGFSWNVLDFGLSYIRASQYADRYMITQERRRKVVHNIIQDVCNSYWNALSAQRLLAKIDPLYNRVHEALKNARKIENERLRSPMEMLTYRRNLLEVLRQLKVMRRELSSAQISLAALMNLKPGKKYTLVDNENIFAIPDISTPLQQLEQVALVNRPELREEAYQKKITSSDVTRAMLGMVPGLQFNYSYNYDSNSYNYADHWADWGVSISYNLLKSFTEGPAQLEMSKGQLEVVDTRRLALSMAVLSQVHISWNHFHRTKEEFETTHELHQVNQGILNEVKNAVPTKSQGEMKLIEAELNTVLAELRRDVTYAEMVNAAGKVFISVGADPLPDTVEDHSIETLSKAIKDTMDGWYSGKMNGRAVSLYQQDGQGQELVKVKAANQSQK
ncbi:TolC family protein [Terasakiella sp. SH-1]|uniref:TolC family protein n=1 Tax=Terasakiella sp. SH-1 TaxID=2560057 RepID=UPI00142F609B|nr:TolC family protein [Terasakiella sp. SH-1]